MDTFQHRRDEEDDESDEENREREEAEVDEKWSGVMNKVEKSPNEAQRSKGETDDKDPLADNAGNAEGALHGETYHAPWW